MVGLSKSREFLALGNYVSRMTQYQWCLNHWTNTSHKSNLNSVLKSTSHTMLTPIQQQMVLTT